MGLFRRPRYDPEELERLKQQLSYMREQFDKAEGTNGELHQRVDTIDAAHARLTEAVAPVGGLADDLAKLGDKLSTAESNAVARDDLVAVSAKIDELGTRLEVWTKSQHALAERLTALDQRVTAVSTELANQLSELSGDIEKLAASPVGAADPKAMDDLLAGQHRLANEQARYQIAFREDLARLAEDLKRAH